MRLIYVSHSFSPKGAPLSNLGGMQRVAMELHDALRRRSDVALRTIALRSSWRWVHVRSVPFLLSVGARLGFEARRFRADAVLFTSMTTSLALLLAGGTLRSQGVSVASIAHGLDITDPNPAYQRALRRIRPHLDLTMPVSRATGDQLRALGLRADQIEVVHNAVDVDRFATPGVPRPSALQIAGARLPKDAFLLVTVGRQVRRKGFSWFIEHVMPKVPERVVFWLAGDGPERPEIDRAIATAGLGKRVRCLGKISEADLVALYGRADLFVMPNIPVPGDMEGFGIVMLEAGACGVPTLAANLEGIRDVIQEGVNGWFCPSGDSEAFATKIRALLDAPGELNAARRSTADYVSSTFRWSHAAQRYLDAIGRLTG
ncbi:MAG: glycosyltransferase family 4 protein [Myxococcota bacterium]